jgi:hypothetical protein
MSRQDRWCRSANDIVIDAWRYARHLGRTTAERIAACENAGDFDQSHNRGPAAERPQAPELRTCRSQLLRWQRLSYLPNEPTIRHGHGTPFAGVSRWV